jgi:hypothetical protein
MEDRGEKRVELFITIHNSLLLLYNVNVINIHTYERQYYCNRDDRAAMLQVGMSWD